MSWQRSTNVAAPDRAPWTPLSVALIAFILPAGGAILTIRNLERLRQFDARVARQLSIAVVVLFAVGLTVLISSAPRTTSGMLQPDATATSILQFGVAAGSYLVQRAPFRAWRLANQRNRTSPWIGGAGLAALYTLLTIVGVLPLYLVAQILGAGTPAAGPA
ncbi:MAG TPA: hypothetical protein VKX16_00980 [Chloroflexota bacterium]|nr:hypothetical protein [Chloroflexota bacterium]